jgi:hypothetical protein
MLYLLKGLQTEWIKTRKTFIVWYVILCPLLLAGLILLMFSFRSAADAKTAGNGINFWQFLLIGGYNSLSYLFLPLFIVLLNTMLYAREHQGNMWKHLYALPVPRWSIFGAKSAFSLILLAFSFVCFALFLLATGYLIDVIQPAYKLAKNDNLFTTNLMLAFRVFVSGLGIWAIHNWLSLRFKGVGISMGIAIASIVITPFVMTGADKIGEWRFLYPYIYAFESAMDYQAGKLFDFWQPETYFSLLYMLVFVGVGYWEYSRNGHK